MAILKEIVSRVSAATGCAVKRADAVKARADAIHSCAVARVSAAKSCALVRVSVAQNFTADCMEQGAGAARLWILLGRERFRAWLMEAYQAHATRVSLRRFNKMMYKLDCYHKKQDYELRVKEYKQWRWDQAEIVSRDHFKRMQKLGMLDKKLEYPKPLRKGLYSKKPSPLPPKKPVMLSYVEYLEATHQYIGVFDRTAQVILKPSASVARLLAILAVLGEAVVEIRTPGTFWKHVRVLALIFKEESATGEDRVEES